MPLCKRKRIKGRELNTLAGCVRFPLVADLPEFNKLQLPGANTNLVPHLAEVVDARIMLMIPVGNHSKAREEKRQEGGASVLAKNCIQKGNFWKRQRI